MLALGRAAVADGATGGADGPAVTDGPPQAVMMSETTARIASERGKDIAMEYRIGPEKSAVAS